MIYYKLLTDLNIGSFEYKIGQSEILEIDIPKLEFSPKLADSCNKLVICENDAEVIT